MRGGSETWTWREKEGLKRTHFVKLFVYCFEREANVDIGNRGNCRSEGETSQNCIVFAVDCVCC